MPPPPESAGPEPLELPRRRPLAGPLGAIVGLLTLVLLTGGLFWLGTLGRSTTVPDFLGLTPAQAAERAKNAHVRLVEQGRGAVTDQPLRVMGQEPPAGSAARRGAMIRLVMTAPTARLGMPDLTGIQLADARRRLTDAGLVVGGIFRIEAPSVPLGAVARQTPRGGISVDTGTSVDLWVAAPPALTAPDLVGLNREQALARAAKAGLAVEFLDETTAEVPPQTVSRQSPAPGGAVARGSKIVAVINAAGGSGPTSSPSPAPARPPSLYATLAAANSFPVLYPSRLPAGLQVVLGAGNPRVVTDLQGQGGFEVRYADPTRPDVGLSLFEGNWFDPSIDAQSPASVRGLSASLGQYPGGVVLTWTERGTIYGVQATGLAQEDVLSFANGLTPVPVAPGAGTSFSAGEQVKSEPTSTTTLATATP